MKKAFLLLLLLIAVGLVGYLVFPKSGELTGTVKKVANNILPTGMTDESQAGQSASTGSTEISEGLTLAITAPTDKSTVDNQALQVIGKTSPNSEVFINDQEGKADSTGNFFINVSLDEGENVLTVVVNDQDGNYAEKELTVYLESTE
jgi:hypothetical protein